MSFAFTPQAAKKLLAIIAAKGENLSLRIDVHRNGKEWRMTLEPRTAGDQMVDGVPVQASESTLKLIDGMIIDWIVTPEGPGLGVYDKNFIDYDTGN